MKFIITLEQANAFAAFISKQAWAEADPLMAILRSLPRFEEAPPLSTPAMTPDQIAAAARHLVELNKESLPTQDVSPLKEAVK